MFRHRWCSTLRRLSWEHCLPPRANTPRMILHHVLANFFRLKARGCLQRVIVVERNHVQDDVLGDGMGRTDEGLATTRALQPVKPQHRNTRLVFHGRDDPRHYGGFESHGGGGGNAEANEVAAIHTMLTEDVVRRGKRLVHGRTPCGNPKSALRVKALSSALNRVSVTVGTKPCDGQTTLRKSPRTQLQGCNER